MNEDGALFDSGFDGVTPFRDTPEARGISLETALRDFGPAALDDLIPRIRALAAVLDAAHATGVVHGALHPSNVIITDTSTSLMKGRTSTRPYVAPEVADGGAPTPKSDQYALAAIAYEWLFGRPVGRSVEVRGMPGVDRAALSAAFTRALAPKPDERHDSCTEFCHRLADAAVPELPLLAFEAEAEPEPVINEPVVPIEPSPADEIRLEPDFDAIDREQPRVDPVDLMTDEKPVPAPFTPPPARTSESARFSGMALILALIVGSIFGFAAGYMARPRALQSGPPQTIAVREPGTEAAVAPKADAPKAEAPAVPPPSPAPVAKAQPAPKAPVAKAQPIRKAPAKAATAKPATAKPAVTTGVLVVESRPTGASVTVNGTPRGVTPLTISDLPAGDYRIVMSMKGFLNFSTTARVVAGERVRAAASLTAQEQE